MKRVGLVILAMAGLIMLAGSGVGPAVAGEVDFGPGGNPVPTASKMSVFIYITADDIDNWHPEVAYNSRHDEYLVVWQNNLGATQDINAQRVTGEGHLKSFFNIIHVPGSWYHEQDVAYSEAQDEYLIVFTHKSPSTGDDIWGRRVKWNGADLGSYPAFPIRVEAGKQYNPAVVYNSVEDEYLVVYQNAWPGGQEDIAAMRIRASDGTLLLWRNIATAPPTAPDELRREPAVAYAKANNVYLIAYLFQPKVFDPGVVRAKRASWNLGTLGEEFSICENGNRQSTVELAAAADTFMAVWEDSPALGTDNLQARRIASEGVPIGPPGGFRVAGPLNQYDFSHDISYGTGYGFLVVWVKNVGTYNDVLGRYLMPGQDWPAGAGYDLDVSAKNQVYPAVACADNGDCLMVEMDNSASGSDFEIVGRFLRPWKNYLPLLRR
jgi:hypothetical protein